MNEIGLRLGFSVTPGLYKGNRTDVGFDGMWKQYDDWSLVVEVKTTDAYRISLDTIANYRYRLAETGELHNDKSSILIVVGRNDTGELEAQIRGSKHAWDIRIISVDSLVRLLRIKESLSDESTAQKISIALRPYEFTRIDQLIDLLFLAIKDVEVEEKAEEFPIDVDDTADKKLAGGKASDKKFTPVSFHEPVFERIREKLKTNFVKQSKSSYSSSDGKIGLVISISKQHPPFNSQFDSRYWFAFHPHLNAFLDRFFESYACYGCGNERKVFMLPFRFLKDRLDLMWKTKGAEREYTHIVIYQKGDNCYLRTNIDDMEHYDDLQQFEL